MSQTPGLTVYPKGVLLETLRRRIIALQEDGYNDDFLRAIREAHRELERKAEAERLLALAWHYIPAKDTELFTAVAAICMPKAAEASCKHGAVGPCPLCVIEHLAANPQPAPPVIKGPGRVTVEEAMQPFGAADSASDITDSLAHRFEAERMNHAALKGMFVPLYDDARRYRRLRVLGAVVNVNSFPASDTVLRFTNLDALVDADIETFPSRGEAETVSAVEGSK